MKTWVEISRSALQHNVRVLTHAARPAKLIAVIKSNAYGHGLVGVAKTIQRFVAWFGVDSVEEGSALRAAGIKKPILVIGYIPDDQLVTCAKKNLSFVVYNTGSLKAIQKLKKGRGTFSVHLAMETGTTREGFTLQELPEVLQMIQRMGSVRVDGAYTHFAIRLQGTYMHFANAERAENSYPQKQLRVYEQALQLMREMGMGPGLRHTASSAAVFLQPGARFDLVRPGIALYGLWPSQEVKKAKQTISLRPVLTWKTIVAQVKDVPKGTPVGYDCTEHVKRRSKIAVLPVGYWDGFDRKASSKGQVLIRGKRCKILGRLCMNMCMVDVTHVPGVKPNDEVVLIGRQQHAELSAEAFAQTIGTIPYEAVTRINPQIPRIFVK